jgi:hypothetical protein
MSPRYSLLYCGKGGVFIVGRRSMHELFKVLGSTKQSIKVLVDVLVNKASDRMCKLQCVDYPIAG